MEQKKKILLVTPMLDQGGLERVCVRTARLLQKDFDVTIAVFDGREILYDVTGLSVVDLQLPSRPGKLGKLLNIFFRSHKLRKLKKKLGIDLSYGFGPTASLSNSFRKGQDVIFSGLRSFLDLGDHRRLQWYAGHSDCLVCCSARIAEEAAKLLPGKRIEVLYNPYNMEEIQEKAAESEPQLPWNAKEREEDTGHTPLLASMGRENDVKGFWHLIKAVAELKRRGIPVRLMIIGEGTFEPYRQLARQLGIEENIFFTGVQKNPYPYLKQADLYVLSSVNEGFPNALVEAMSLALPAIAANCPSGPAEILMENYQEKKLQGYSRETYGILLPELGRERNLDPQVLEPEEKILADAVQLLLQDRECYAYYAGQAAKRAAFFSDQAYLQKLTKMMQESYKL